MRTIDEANTVLAKISALDFSTADVEPMPGGSNNRSYLVRTEQGWFVLRLSDTHDVPEGVDRRRELAVHEAASNAGIASTIIFASLEDGVMLTEYVAGARLRETELERRVVIEQLASLLRSVHELPATGAPVDLVAAAHRYRERIADESLADAARRCVDIVAELSSNDDVACCHNDMVVGNIIASDRLRLIDWEYAGCNDPYFDLGVLINHHDLSAETAELLLHAYTGGASVESRERLDRQRRVYDAIHFLWLAARVSGRAEKESTARLQVLLARLS